YNVQLITDVNGKPMPQYYDETEGVMKPITRNNGEVTGDINANVSFPETQNVNGTVSVDNFPQTQQVEVTNQKEVQDVNVTNQATSVDVNNFPKLQDVSDEQVRAELEQIKDTQSQILERLDDVNNGISVKNTGEVIKIMEIDGSYNSQIEEGQEVIWNIYAPVGWSVVDVSDIRIWISKPSGSQGYHRIQFNRIVLESGGGLGTYSLD